MTRGFGWLGDLLAAPAARWDSSWYLVIAHYGYRPELGSVHLLAHRLLPALPAGLRAIAGSARRRSLAGVLLSVLALAPRAVRHPPPDDARARVACRRSHGSDRGDVARLAVLVTAFAPMAFFFSAVYSESLYLALSVGVFWFARQGRWAWVGVLGALAGATRSTGLVLALPALILYLYGPREDRPPDSRRARPFAAPALPPAPGRRCGSRCCPRALGLYMGYLALAGGDALAPFHAQQVWGRHFAGPYLGAWDGIKAGFDGARQLLSLQRHHVYFPIAAGDPFVIAGHNLMLLGLPAWPALVATVGVLRVLPLAYGAYVRRGAGAAALLPGARPAADVAAALPRGAVPARHLARGVARRAPARADAPRWPCSALLMAFFAAQFATWHWVA